MFYSLIAYIWLPYAIRIFQIFYHVSFFRSNSGKTKALVVSILGVLFSGYGIFWEVNEISLLIVYAIELALPMVQKGLL